MTAAVLAGAALTGCADAAPRAADAAESAHADAETSPLSAEPAAGEAAQTSAACLADARAVGRPSDLPADLPLPDGAVLTGSEHRSGHRLIVTAVAHGFRPTLTFLQQRLPAAGYRLTDGEVEEHDAESNFTSAAARGRWTLRELPGCGGDVVLTVLVAPR